MQTTSICFCCSGVIFFLEDLPAGLPPLSIEDLAWSREPLSIEPLSIEPLSIEPLSTDPPDVARPRAGVAAAVGCADFPFGGAVFMLTPRVLSPGCLNPD